jgi:hypothetical protein
MKRRTFLKNISWVGTGLVAFPAFAFVEHNTTNVLNIPSEVQIRHGVFNLNLSSKTSPNSWIESIRHNRFLTNGYAIGKEDLISYSFEHLQQQYQLLYKEEKCYWYPPDMEHAILLHENIPHWNSSSFEVNFINSNIMLQCNQTCYLLPLEEDTIVNNQTLTEGQMLRWVKPNHHLEITKPIIIIKQKN